MFNLNSILIFLLAYLIGSFSGSMFVSKTFFKEDIREKGSGNAGTTNTFRAYGLKYSLISLVIDFAKGYLAVFIANYLATNYFVSIQDYSKYIAGVAVIVGHVWPIYHGFKGGKGMATSFGVNLYFAPIVFLIQVAELVAINLLFKIMSLTSIIITLTVLVYVGFQGDTAWFIMTLINSIIIIYSHRSNIVRLINNEENTISRLEE